MRSVAVVAATGALVMAMAAGHAGAAGMAVERIEVCRDVVDRSPEGCGTSFPADVGQLACFTHVTGTEGESGVVHVWYRGEEEVARVRLAVSSPSWRTWSRKKVPPEWSGAWRVVVESEEGDVLGELSFTVGE